jgi:glycerol-3-phosphate dehydrogenase
MAEDAADHVCEFLGVDADCQTDEQRIRFVDDADRLDAMVRRYQAVNPTGEALQDSA